MKKLKKESILVKGLVFIEMLREKCKGIKSNLSKNDTKEIESIRDGFIQSCGIPREYLRMEDK